MPTAASPWRRLMGIAYECIVLFGVLWFFDYAFSALTQFKGHPGPLRTAFQWFTWAVLGTYFISLWSGGRRTLPMKTLDLALVTETGGPVGPWRAAGRFAAASASLLLGLAAAHAVHPLAGLVGVVAFLWPLVDPHRRALYDLLAGTRLVVLAVRPARPA